MVCASAYSHVRVFVFITFSCGLSMYVCAYMCIFHLLWLLGREKHLFLLTLSPFLYLGVHHSRLYVLDIQSLFGIISKSI